MTVVHKMSILVFPEQGQWSAQCIGFKLATQARTLKEMPGAIRDMLVGHYKVCKIENLRPFDSVLCATPSYLRNAWDDGVLMKKSIREELFPTVVLDQFSELEMRLHSEARPPYISEAALAEARKGKSPEEIQQIVANATVVKGIHDLWSITDAGLAASTLHLEGKHGMTDIVVTKECLQNLGAMLTEGCTCCQCDCGICRGCDEGACSSCDPEESS